MESNCCKGMIQNGIVSVKDFVMNAGLKSKIVGGALTVATIFGGVAANNSQAYARTPIDHNIELVEEYPPADSTNKQTSDRNKIKINGADTRGQGMSLEDIQSAVTARSHQHLVVYVEVDKGDADYENLIKDAVRDNIRAGRDNIYLVFADRPDGASSKMACVYRGQLSLPLIKGKGHNESAFIARVYNDHYLVNNKDIHDAPGIAGTD